LILVGSWKSSAFSGVFVSLATTGVILAAVYLLWMVYRTFFGEITHEENRTMKDLNFREIALIVPLAVLMVWLGLGPAPFLEKSEATVQAILNTAEAKARAVEAAAGQPDVIVQVPLRWPDAVAATE
ncbi:MAG: Fe-S-binding domain-containing protein, partial [Bacteroidetes bacterium]|nr:Fe-S-binding domain-containing protein [Bacteroidota bacterium]